VLSSPNSKPNQTPQPSTQAGGNGGALETRVPAGLARLFRHPRLDWNLYSALQQLLGDREVRCCS